MMYSIRTSESNARIIKGLVNAQVVDTIANQGIVEARIIDLEAFLVLNGASIDNERNLIMIDNNPVAELLEAPTLYDKLQELYRVVTARTRKFGVSFAVTGDTLYDGLSKIGPLADGATITIITPNGVEEITAEEARKLTAVTVYKKPGPLMIAGGEKEVSFSG